MSVGEVSLTSVIVFNDVNGRTEGVEFVLYVSSPAICLQLFFHFSSVSEPRYKWPGAFISEIFIKFYVVTKCTSNYSLELAKPDSC